MRLMTAACVLTHSSYVDDGTFLLLLTSAAAVAGDAIVLLQLAMLSLEASTEWCRVVTVLVRRLSKSKLKPI